MGRRYRRGEGRQYCRDPRGRHLLTLVRVYRLQKSDQFLGQLPHVAVQRGVQELSGVLPADTARLQGLEDDQVGGGRGEIFTLQALAEQIPGAATTQYLNKNTTAAAARTVPAHSSKEVGPESDLCLAGASHHGLPVDGEGADEIHNTWQQSVRNGFFGSCLLLQDRVEKKLQTVLEVRKVGAGGGDVPGVLPEVPPYELSEELVKVNLANSLHRAEGE